MSMFIELTENGTPTAVNVMHISDFYADSNGQGSRCSVVIRDRILRVEEKYEQVVYLIEKVTNTPFKYDY